VINGVFFVAGGEDGSGSAKLTVDAYNPATNTWTTKGGLLPEPQGGMGSGVISGKLYAVGGSGPASSATTILRSYDPTADLWTDKAPMPTGRYYLASVVVKGQLYAIGGADENGAALAANEVYTP
jgi:N-acetylneuraminic acid mutarotase